MRITVSPKINPVDTDDHPYPLVFRLSRWNYAIAAATLVMSVFFIVISFYQDGFAAIMLFTIGSIFIILSILYILLVKNAFIEVDRDKMRCRDIRKITEFDLNQIYVEIMNGILILYSPQHRKKSISSYYKNSTLLHSLLYKQSELNTARAESEGCAVQTYDSFTDPISGSNRKAQKFMNILVPLLFIGVNIYNYTQHPDRSLIYYISIFLLTAAGYGIFWYIGRRRAVRSPGK